MKGNAILDPIIPLVFVVAVVLLSLTPGPDLFLLLGRGISQGRRAAVLTAVGFFCAGFVQVPLLALGLSGLVAQHPILFDLMRYAGGGYLVWRGVQMFRTSGMEQPGVALPRGSALREGFVASLANPKSHVFLLAFLPQFVDPSPASVALQFAVLGLVMRLTALAVEASVALLAGRAGAWLRRSAGARNWLERAAAAILIVIGPRLILLERPDPAPVHP